MSRLFASRKACLLALAVLFVVSRVAYFLAGVRFSDRPLGFYLQYLDPLLIREAFWQSLFYLREQPPLFNLFLGTVLKLVPGHAPAGFHAAYLAMGLVLILALFLLLDEMKVERHIALSIALLFSVSPATILYENWLFYSYPLTLFFCTAALFLCRYASRGSLRDGVLFFSSLAALGLIRVVYHLFWFWLIVLTAWLLLRPLRRRTLTAAALPGLLLTAFYVKHLLLWGSILPGSAVMQPVNLAEMATQLLPAGALDSLIAQKKISTALKTSMYQVDPATVVPKPPSTGIPLLDRPVKSTGAVNWNAMWFADVGAVYRRDAKVVVRYYPAAFLDKVFSNLQEYCLTSDDVWPFDRDPKSAGQTEFQNTQSLNGLFTVYYWIVTAQGPDSDDPWLLYFVFPALLLFGLAGIVSWLRRTLRHGPEAGNPQAVTLLFCVGNVAYLSAVVILFSHGDQNRYRDEVSALYALLLGLALTRIHRRFFKKAR